VVLRYRTSQGLLPVILLQWSAMGALSFQQKGRYQRPRKQRRYSYSDTPAPVGRQQLTVEVGTKGGGEEENTTYFREPQGTVPASNQRGMTVWSTGKDALPCAALPLPCPGCWTLDEPYDEPERASTCTACLFWCRMWRLSCH